MAPPTRRLSDPAPSTITAPLGNTQPPQTEVARRASSLSRQQARRSLSLEAGSGAMPSPRASSLANSQAGIEFGNAAVSEQERPKSAQSSRPPRQKLPVSQAPVSLSDLPPLPLSRPSSEASIEAESNPAREETQEAQPQALVPSPAASTHAPSLHAPNQGETQTPFGLTMSAVPFHLLDGGIPSPGLSTRSNTDLEMRDAGGVTEPGSMNSSMLLSASQLVSAPLTGPSVPSVPEEMRLRPIPSAPEISAAASDAAGSTAVVSHRSHRSHREGPPPKASHPAYFGMQMVRHAAPVGAVRTVVQGLAAPALAAAVATDPKTAVAVQASMILLSVARRVLAQQQSEKNMEIANRSFSGQVEGGSALSRRVWQGVQTTGNIAGDTVATSLTALSIHHPQLKPIAQALAMVQMRAHPLSHVREFSRPMINTVHVGNVNGTHPDSGRNLRPEDVGVLTSVEYGVAVALIEFGTNLAIQTALGHQPAWDASLGQALLAGGIAGVGNMLSSSVEDHLIDNRVAKRMQTQSEDPTHVPHIRWEFKNPLALKQLGRQLERVDTRVFNQMVPAMLAQAIWAALAPLLEGNPAKPFVQALVNAATLGLLLGALLPKTVQSYQMNDALREHVGHTHAHTHADPETGASSTGSEENSIEENPT